jgi:hypothetical protein
VDFYGTLYWNPSEDFSVNIDPNNTLEAEYFFSELANQTPFKDLEDTEIILVSGRPAHQKEVILYLLKRKGYTIIKSYFLGYNLGICDDENSFLNHYWFWKVNILNEIIKGNWLDDSLKSSLK